ncbi:hypothetical protein A3850_005620 [Lewinella sp. 4G2]|nr:hypothetical protein A3850_005620 [Lewinella sp. 4G2]
MANNFGNDGGQPADLNFSDEIDTRQGIGFAQAILDLSAGWRVTAGLSANTLRYQVDRTFDANAQPGAAESDFGLVLSPRLAVLKELRSVSIYASVADGFSPPTLDEFRTNEGSLNVTLAPERGVNYEVGAKGNLDRISYELAIYHFNLRESITTFSDERDTRLFQNAGGTRQYGIEISGRYALLEQLQLGANYTYQEFTYRDFVRDGNDVSGAQLPGSAPHTINLLVDYGFATGLYANVHYNYTDAIPLNDAGTVFGNAYHLLRARLGWRAGRWDVFLSGNNLLDQEMSFGNDLNPRFGGRYFQPAAGINGVAGVKWRW